MSLNLNAALSSFIAASPRIIYHYKTQHWKKKPLPLTCLATKTLSVCEPSILIVVVVARAGLFTVRQIREWATYVFIYFYFALRHRPLSLPQSPPHQCCAGAGSGLYHIWKLLYSVASPIFLVIFSATVYQEVTILFSLTRWMETVLYSHMFYAIFQFCA